MIRYISLGILFILISISGNLAANFMRKRYCYIKKSSDILFLISEKITYRRLPLSQIMLELNDTEINFINKIPEKLQENRNFKEVWNESVKEDYMLPDDAKLILEECGKILGKSYSEVQAEQLKEYIKNLSKLSEDMKTKLDEKSRLYTTSGVLLGLFVVIMLI